MADSEELLARLVDDVIEQHEVRFDPSSEARAINAQMAATDLPDLLGMLGAPLE